LLLLEKLSCYTDTSHAAGTN